MVSGRFFYGVFSEAMIDERTGRTFIETIEPGAFSAGIERGDDIAMRMEHLDSVVIASVGKGTLRLTDDPVQLYFEADPTGDEVGVDAIREVRAGNAFISPTFRRQPGGTTFERDSSGMELRRIVRATLHDLSVLTTSRPAYRMAALQWTHGRQPALETRSVERGGYCRGVLGAGPSMWRE